MRSLICKWIRLCGRHWIISGIIIKGMKNSKQSKIIGVIILLAIIFLLPLLAMGQEADSVVMLTGDTFHVGNTSVSYEVAQRRNGRQAIFNMFGLDGFMDPNYIGEALLGKGRSDGLGPHYELGGTPYYYGARVRVYYMGF